MSAAQRDSTLPSLPRAGSSTPSAEYPNEKQDVRTVEEAKEPAEESYDDHDVYVRSLLSPSSLTIDRALAVPNPSPFPPTMKKKRTNSRSGMHHDILSHIRPHYTSRAIFVGCILGAIGRLESCYPATLSSLALSGRFEHLSRSEDWFYFWPSAFWGMLLCVVYTTISLDPRF